MNDDLSLIDCQDNISYNEESFFQNDDISRISNLVPTSKSVDEEQILFSTKNNNDMIKSLLSTVYKKSLQNFDDDQDLVAAAREILNRPVFEIKSDNIVNRIKSNKLPDDKIRKYKTDPNNKTNSQKQEKE
jgi:hypothetical protein